MAIYRANPKDGVAWITGASTGIGRSLALDLAAEGYIVAVTARDEERLVSLQSETAGPGRIVSFPCDVTDGDAMLATVVAIEEQLGSIALAVFNAGTYFPTRGERLDALNIINSFDINLFGALHGLVPVVERMRLRGQGHVVFVGSASSFFGWPSAAAYGATKAALSNFAESLKHDFDKMNIRIQIVNPGFVDTPLTEKTGFSMPALVPVADASKRMAKGFRDGGFEISFPRRLNWPLKLLRMLPFSFRFWLIHKITGWKDRPMAKARKPRT